MPERTTIKKCSTTKFQCGFKGMRRKKTARLAGGFSGILGVLRALTPLSIRQRSEIPKKVKVKLDGHGEIEVAGQKG
jgi:hypothetical protein